MRGWMLQNSSKVSYWLLIHYFLSSLMFPLAGVSRAMATTHNDMEGIRAMRTPLQIITAPETTATKNISVTTPQISTSRSNSSSSPQSSWQFIYSNKEEKRATVSLLPSLDTKKTPEIDKDEDVNQNTSESRPTLGKVRISGEILLG
ncbi:hypothetical protein R2X23_03880 [Citrobacter braakii]|uniref:hypothetical protein n=1 Tax=Citrobacter braakii TaxID=57706 RepID=UPI0024E0D300|nr:hypothetical protein [Citrobacter braakii]WOR25850.1 hypothetical protein R2X23_03880 [Citrobacter braakii]